METRTIENQIEPVATTTSTASRGSKTKKTDKTKSNLKKYKKKSFAVEIDAILTESAKHVREFERLANVFQTKSNKLDKQLTLRISNLKLLIEHIESIKSIQPPNNLYQIESYLLADLLVRKQFCFLQEIKKLVKIASHKRTARKRLRF